MHRAREYERWDETSQELVVKAPSVLVSRECSLALYVLFLMVIHVNEYLATSEEPFKFMIRR